MKNKYIVSSLALALLFGCVPDSRDLNMPDSAVYFVDNVVNKGIQSVLMYDVQSEVETPVHVYCSGLAGGSTNVSASVSEAYLAYYNTINGTELKALPEECYSIKDNSLEMTGRNASFALNFKVSEIAALSAQDGVDLEDYVVALKLDSDNLPVATVKDTTSLGYYLVRPDLREALAVVSTEVLEDNKIALNVELPFENQWTFSYELDFGKSGAFGLSQSRGNLIPAKYVCSPAPADLLDLIKVDEVSASSLTTFSILPGSKTAQHVITVPAKYVRNTENSVPNNYAVGIKSVELNGKEIAVVNNGHLIAAYGTSGGISTSMNLKYTTDHGWYHAEGFLNDEANYYRHTLEPYGLEAYPESDHKSFIYSPESTAAGNYHEHYVFDGTGNAWFAAWDKNGYGFQGDFDMKAIVDMNKVQTLSGAEVWLRVGRWIGDVDLIEFYAVDNCTYEYKKGTMNYADDALTYLGKITYNYTHLGYCTLDSVDTQYILLNFRNRQGRTFSFECTEIVLYH